MAGCKRIELLSVVGKKDVENLCEVTKKLSKEGTLADTIVEFNKRQLEELWDGVLSVCMSTLLDSGENNEQHLDEMFSILLCITNLALATLKSMKQLTADPEEGRDMFLPQSLQETAIILHGVLPTLAPERKQLKDKMSRLFEDWWNQELDGREELMGNTVVYLLHKSTEPKSTQADVNRIKGISKVLSAIDLTSDNAAAVVSLLLQCTHHPQFLTTPQGIKFLSYLFTLGPDLIEKLHNSIKNHLPNTPKSWHKKYGEIYFRTWQKTSGDIREKVELYCIQDLMYRAVHAHRSGQGSVSAPLFKVLSSIHKEKTQRGVEAMLTRLYEPILWRSLRATNSDVRINATSLMFDVFPLQDPSLHNEQADALLQRQFDLMHTLLSDPVAEVRLTAVRGVGRVLNIYWELMPSQVIQCLITSLVQDLAYDISSPAIREAVIKVMHQLCDNHLCIPMLKKILPELRNFVHDTSEKVRVAMFDLLVKVKGLRAIKFWNIVPVEHILARLEVDSTSIARRIMKLIFSSFVPVQQPPAEQVERCVTLVKANLGAARQFFLHVPEQLGLSDTVKYMTMLCRYVLESVRQLQGGNHGDLSSNSDGSFSSSGNDSHTVQSTGSKNSKQSGAKRSKRESSGSQSEGQISSTETDSVEDETVEEDEVNSNETVDVLIIQGLVEGIYLMFTTILGQLSSTENKAMKESLAKKLSITVRELMTVSQDPGLDTALIGLAGHLPSKALPLVSQNLLNRLKRGSQSGESMDTTSIVKSLVLWGKADCIVEMVKESFEAALAEAQFDRAEDSSEQKSKQKKKKAVGFIAEELSIDPTFALDLIVRMISQAECRPVLLRKHRESLMALIDTLRPVMTKLKMFLTSPASSTQSQNVDLLVQFYAMYLRLAALLCLKKEKENKDCSTEGDVDAEGDGVARKAIDSALSWTRTCVLSHIQTDVEAERNGETPARLIEVTLNICRTLMMVGVCDASILDQLIELGMTIFQELPTCLRLTTPMLACVYQVTQLRKPQPGAGESPSISGKGSLGCHDDLVCSCLGKFLESLTESMREEKMDSNGKDDPCGKDDSVTCDRFLRLVASASPAVSEIILELTQPGRSTEVAEKTLTCVLQCVMKETQHASKNDSLVVGERLPCLSLALVGIVAKRKTAKRMFTDLLHNLVDTGELVDIHQLCGLVTVMAALRNGSPDLVTPSLCQSVSRALSLTLDQNSDVVRDLKREIEDKLQQWNRSDVVEVV